MLTKECIGLQTAQDFTVMISTASPTSSSTAAHVGAQPVSMLVLQMQIAPHSPCSIDHGGSGNPTVTIKGRSNVTLAIIFAARDSD